MRVFVTGATGFIGSAVVAELLSAGHSVLGLARSDTGAEALKAAGAEVHRGDLTDHDSLRAGARACDGVAHLAFIHEFSRHEENGRIDHAAVTALVEALAGSGKPLAVTSGTAVLAGLGRPVTEDDAGALTGPGAMRVPSEITTLEAAAHGVRSSVIRLPPSVHGQGDHGSVPMLIDAARQAGTAAYVGAGDNLWPAVHRRDAARVFRLALETAPAGVRLHAAAEGGVPFRRVAETIGEGLGLPVRSVSIDEAPQVLGWLSRFAQIDNPTASDITRRTLGWEPREIGLIEDIRTAGYF